MTPAPLEPGERLIRAARSDREIGLLTGALVAILGILASWAVLSAIRVGGGAPPLSGEAMIGALFCALPVIAVTCLRRPSHYLLTDRRVILVDGSATPPSLPYDRIRRTRRWFGSVSLIGAGATLTLAYLRDAPRIEAAIRSRMEVPHG